MFYLRNVIPYAYIRMNSTAPSPWLPPRVCVCVSVSVDVDTVPGCVNESWT